MKPILIFFALLVVFASCTKGEEEDIVPNPIPLEGSAFVGKYRSTQTEINGVVATKYVSVTLTISMDTIFDRKGRISEYRFGEGVFTIQEYHPLYKTTSTETFSGTPSFQPGTLPGGETYMGFSFNNSYEVCITESTVDGGSSTTCHTAYLEVVSFLITSSTGSSMVIERLVNKYKHRYNLVRVK